MNNKYKNLKLFSKQYKSITSYNSLSYLQTNIKVNLKLNLQKILQNKNIKGIFSVAYFPKHQEAEEDFRRTVLNFLKSENYLQQKDYKLEIVSVTS